MRVLRPGLDLLPLGLVGLLIVAAIAAPQWLRKGPGTLAIVIDTSGSVPVDVRVRAVRRIEESLPKLPGGTRLAVFEFDEEARLVGTGEVHRGIVSPRIAASLRRVERAPAGRTTNIGRALAHAAQFVLLSGGGSLLLATDGVDLAGGAREWAAWASSAGIDLQVLPMERSEPEASIEQILVPRGVLPREVFQATALVRSTVDQTVDVSADMDGSVVAHRRDELKAGALQAVSLPVAAGASPSDLLVFLSAPADFDRGNNVARARIPVQGAGRFAVLGDDGIPAAAFTGALGVAVDRWRSLPPVRPLDAYDGIYIALSDNVRLSLPDQDRLADYVRGGGALLVSCADAQRAAEVRGGPLEDVLPVRLEPPGGDKESAAIVLLLDRSGSMGGPGAEPSPLERASEAASALGSLLSYEDRYGVVAFDVAPRVVRSLSPIGEPAEPSPPAALTATGGTDWTSALDLALGWLAADPAPRRHIILVSDGALGPGVSGEPTRDWPEGVTLSTVAVGVRAKTEALERLAAAHGGRFDRIEAGEDLPAALKREEARFRPPLYRRGPLTIQPETPFLRILPAFAIGRASRVLRIRRREDAEILMTTSNGDTVAAAAQRGWGHAAFLAVDPEAIPSSHEVRARILASLLRRHRGSDPAAHPAPFVSLQEARATVDLLLPEQVRLIPSTSVRFPSGLVQDIPLMLNSPGLARGSFLAVDPGEYRVESNGSRSRLDLAAAPERAMLPRDPSWAASLAQAGAGRVIPRDGGVSRSGLSIRSHETSVELAPWLLGLSALIFFIDSGIRLRRLSSFDG